MGFKISSKLNLNKIPEHIGIIMDGNGRWATRRGLPRTAGHKAGVERLREIAELCSELQVKFLTVFAFSTENWKRPKEEVDEIFRLTREYIKNDENEFVKRNIKVKIIGDITVLAEDLIDAIKRIEKTTEKCSGLVLTLAVNYGGRDDIIRAVNSAVKKGKAVDKEDFAKLLYTGGMPDPDIIIRTSGEQRVSNFLLYQMAYSEFIFSKAFWPDFSGKEFQNAIIDFQKRTRRFGTIQK